MRFVLYNIRYAAGAARNFHLPVPGAGYLRQTDSNLQRLIHFFEALDPDILGLVEVDLGSFRTGTRRNQAETIAAALGHGAHVFECKYNAKSVHRFIPVLNKQGNAFITRHSIQNERFHFFSRGMKRLIIELELENLSIFLVHLSLGYRDRQRQLNDLQRLILATPRPVMVAGDFNTFFGEAELYAFLSTTGLLSANLRGQPTHPSRSPRRELDFIFHDPRIVVTGFEVPAVTFSDHLPLVCDFEVRAADATAPLR